MDQITDEIWRPVAGYEGSYEVSNRGRVRSLPRMVARAGRVKQGLMRQSGRILRPLRHPGGYRHVMFWKDGQYQNAFIHALVLEAFVGPRPENSEAAHNDGSKDNNILENLRWATRSENQADREIHGTGRIGKGSYIRNRFGPEMVAAMRVYHRETGLPIGAVARHFGLPRTTVADIVNMRTHADTVATTTTGPK